MHRSTSLNPRAGRLVSAAVVVALAAGATTGCASSGNVAAVSVSAEMQSDPATTQKPAQSTTTTTGPSSTKAPLGSTPRRSTTTTDRDSTDTTEPPETGDSEAETLVKSTFLEATELPGPAALPDHGYTEQGEISTSGAKLGFGSCKPDTEVNLVASFSGKTFDLVTEGSGIRFSQLNGLAESDGDASQFASIMADIAIQDCLIEGMVKNNPTATFVREEFTRVTPADVAVGIQVTRTDLPAPGVVYVVLLQAGRFLSLVVLTVSGADDGTTVDAVMTAVVDKMRAAS